MSTPVDLEVNELVVLGHVPSEATRATWEGDPLIRAWGIPSWADAKALVFLTGPSGDVTTRSAELCPDDPDCVHYLMVQIGRVIPSTLSARSANTMALLTVQPGFVTAFADHLVGVQSRLGDEVEVAGALLYGAGPATALVEVVGDDLTRVDQVLRSLTDRLGVTRVSTLVFRFDDTFGWGG